MAITRRDLENQEREARRTRPDSAELRNALREQRRSFESNHKDLLKSIIESENNINQIVKYRLNTERELKEKQEQYESMLAGGANQFDPAVEALHNSIEMLKRNIRQADQDMSESKDFIEDNIKRLGKADLFKLIEKREESISKKIENRVKAEKKLDELSQEYERNIRNGLSETDPAMVAIDKHMRKLEDTLTFLDGQIDRDQDFISQGMDRLRKGAVTFWDDWTDSERDAFTRHLDQIELTSDQIENTLDKIHGRIADDLDDLERDLHRTLTEQLEDFSNTMREWADTFSLQAISSSLTDSLDSFLKNRRQLLTFSANIDVDAFGRYSNQLVHDFRSVSREEASDFIQEFMTNGGYHDIEEAMDVIPEILAATKAFGVSADAYSNIQWRAQDVDGNLVGDINNYAAALEEYVDENGESSLYVKAADLISEINDKINDITAIAAGDKKISENMIKSVMGIKTIQESIYNQSVDRIADMASRWSTMSEIELYQDEDFLHMMTAASMSGFSFDAKDFREAVLGGTADEFFGDLLKSVSGYADSVKGNEDEATMFGSIMGFSYAEVMQLASSFGDIDTILEDSKNALDMAEVSNEEGTSLAMDKESRTVSLLEDWQNETTTWFTIITDKLSDWNITGTSIMTTVGAASNALFGISKALDFFGGPGTAGNLLSKLPLVGKLFSRAGSGGGAGGGGGGILSGLRNLFSGGGAGGGGGSGLLSGLKNTLGSVFSSAKGFVTSNAGVLTDAASVLGPIAGGVWAVADAYKGLEKSSEWLGEEGNTGVGQLSSALGSALGGTKSGVGGALSGAAKGALIGSVVPGVGTAIGAAVGGVLGAVGGENISKFVDSTFHVIGDAGTALFDSFGSGISDMNDMLQEMGPLGKTVGDTITNSWNAIDNTRKNIENIWADPDTGLASKIGASVGSLFSGGGQLAVSILKSATDLAKNTWDSVTGFAESAWNKIEDVSSEIWGGFLDGVGALSDAATDILSGVGGVFESAGKGVGNVISSVGDGIKSVFSGGTDFLSGVGDLLFGDSSGDSPDISGVLDNLTGDSILDRMDILIGYTKYIADNGSVSSRSVNRESSDELVSRNGGVLGAVTNTVFDAYDFGKEVITDASNLVGGFFDSIFPFAEGSSYISNDGLAYLHEGEAVLTKEQASVVRSPADGGIDFETVSNIFDFDGVFREIFDGVKSFVPSNLEDYSSVSDVTDTYNFVNNQDYSEIYKLTEAINSVDSAISSSVSDTVSSDFNIDSSASSVGFSNSSNVSSVDTDFSNFLFENREFFADTYGEESLDLENWKPIYSNPNAESTNSLVSDIYDLLSGQFEIENEANDSMETSLRMNGLVGGSGSLGDSNDSSLLSLLLGVNPTGKNNSTLMTLLKLNSKSMSKGGSSVGMSGLISSIFGIPSDFFSGSAKNVSKPGYNKKNSMTSYSMSDTGTGTVASNSYRKSSGSSTANTVEGTDNKSLIWNFLADKGMSAEGIAGLMGNLNQESDLIFDNLQNDKEGKSSVRGLTDSIYADAVDSGAYDNFAGDGAGYGLAQWTFGSRKQGLLDLANERGTSISDPYTQLEYLWSELENSSFFDSLMNATDVDEATKLVMNEFEKPSAEYANLDNRLSFANSTYNSMKSSGGVTNNSSSYSGGSSGNFVYEASGPEIVDDTLTLVNNFPYFSQKDSRWGNTKYMNSNIYDIGCGVTSLAMVLKSFDVDTDPAGVVADMKRLGTQSIFNSRVVAGNYGISTNNLSGESAIVSALQRGEPVVVHGYNHGLFSQRGHFVVLTGIDSDGNYLVNDPQLFSAGSRTVAGADLFPYITEAWSFSKDGMGSLASDLVDYGFEDSLDFDTSMSMLGSAKSSVGKDGLEAYDVGTPWVPEDQVAVIHQGEMIVPKDLNPLSPSSDTYTTDFEMSSLANAGSSNNDSVVDTLKWQVSRMESKMDKVISAINSLNQRRVNRGTDFSERLYSASKDV